MRIKEASLSGLVKEEKMPAIVLLRRIANNSYEAAYENGDKKWKEIPGRTFPS